ncbi:MAG: DUF6266 family protein [Fermentimonas sp.]|nr:DUF6266 family protein [Fermentimonas sp.]
MARIKITGIISGKVGTVSIYETKHGTQVVRSITKAHDPKTPKQLAHRMKFSLINKGLSPLNEAIKIGFRGDSRTYRKQISRAYHEAIAGEYPNFTLDYSKIKIAEGEVQLPADIAVKIHDNSQLVSFTWNPDISSNANNAGEKDMVKILCLNETLKETTQLTRTVRRSAGEASIELPEGWIPADTHLWFYLKSNDSQKNSDSVYLK